jgi:hypothetical protein
MSLMNSVLAFCYKDSALTNEFMVVVLAFR